METRENVEKILGYLRGGAEVNISVSARDNPEMLARCITYVLNERYHRQNTVSAILSLLNKSPPTYRGMAWNLIQMIPLSFLLEVLDVMDKKDNTKKLRHAIATKLATSGEKQIFRAFFMKPSAFRNLFTRLYLPREKFKDNNITNKSYKIAQKLSNLSIPKALEEFNIKKEDLVKTFNLKFEHVANLIETPEEAIKLAKILDSKNLFHHIRWFRNILGDNDYEKMALKKLEYLKNPMEFLSNRNHLEATGALTPKIIEFIERRTKEIFAEMMKDFNLDRLSLIVDVSGSMNVAVQVTSKLYEAFSQSTNITDLIAFNTIAFEVEPERLKTLHPNGGTSIGSSILLLKQRIDSRNGENVPQAIIIVTDLQENAAPYLPNALPLLEEYNNPPLIIVLIGRQPSLKIDYPHAIVAITDFHKSLVMQVFQNIARVTSKVAVKEQKITKILVERRPIEEEIGTVELHDRPAETYKVGYLRNLLCP